MGKAGWDRSQRTGIAGAGIKAMAEGGKFGIALLVSEALRVMTDPKADLEDVDLGYAFPDGSCESDYFYGLSWCRFNFCR